MTHRSLVPPPPVRTDLALLLRHAAHGSASAFAVVYDATAPLAFGLATSILGDARLAERACRDAYVEAWEQAFDFDPARGSATAWVLAIAHRHAVDRRQAEDRPAVRDAAPVVSTNEADRVRHTLALLPRAQRRAVELAYLRGLTAGEIAVLTDTTEGGAELRIRRGLERLRDEL